MDFVLFIGLLHPVLRDGQIYLSLQLWRLSVCVSVQLWTETTHLKHLRYLSVTISFPLADQILGLLEGCGLITEQQWYISFYKTLHNFFVAYPDYGNKVS